MRQYGIRKATEFTKKQISVIYARAKSGDLRVERFYMSHLYDMAEYYGYDDDGSAARQEQTIMRILDLVFAGNMAEAQALIDREQETLYSAMSRKARERASREMVA